MELYVSTHSRPKAAGFFKQRICKLLYVSTHSRPKAAGFFIWRTKNANHCFNTQPPEGGWHDEMFDVVFHRGFNTQPPEGGWGVGGRADSLVPLFQHTAARRRLASVQPGMTWLTGCFNTQPPEGGWGNEQNSSDSNFNVSTHSRPKAAGLIISGVVLVPRVSTHSRPKAAGFSAMCISCHKPFQHTAARRRLAYSKI